jgi:hypothetical protein
MLDNLKTSEDVQKVILNPIDYLPQQKQELNDIEYERISHGMNIYNKIKANTGDVVMLFKNNQLVAISQATNDGLKPKKVFI